jgi:amino acid adenylation domain-containing protein
VRPGPALLEAPPSGSTTVGAADAATTTAGAFVFPATCAQQRLWYLDQVEPGSTTYNIPRAFRLTGELRVDALEGSLRAIVRRHETLRTTLQLREGSPVQVIAPEVPTSILERVDLADLAPDERARRADALIRDESTRPFDLAAGPLIRASLVRLGAREHVLLLVLHHIVAEGGWSMRVLLEELGAHYEAAVAGGAPAVPDLPIQYADFAVWQRDALTRGAFSSQLDYWRARLADAPAALELRTDHPRPAVARHRGATASRTLPPALVRAVRAAAGREGVTLPMALLAVWSAYLARHSGQHDILVAMPIAGRARPETTALIGLFANTLVIRVSLAGDPSCRELLRRVREETLGAFANEDAPFERVVEAVRPPRAPGRMPLVQVAFAPQHEPRRALSLHGLNVTSVETHGGGAAFDLTLFAYESDDPDDVRLALEFRTDLYDAETIRHALDCVQWSLEHMAADLDRPAADLPTLHPTERERVLVRWNDTARPSAVRGSITDRFESRVRAAPDAVALEWGAAALTYAALDRQANQLAHHLRALGVARHTLVGVAVERSPAMVVAVIGILKAGGAYVPLDPGYPDERLSFMLDDAALGVLVVDSASRARFGAFRGRVVCLDDHWPAIARRSDRAPAPAPTGPDDLAYVMYTSGSTGRPNGVEVTHAGVLRLVVDVDYVPLGPGRRVAQLAPSSFDASTFELWGALLNGARCVLAPNELPSTALLRSLVRRHGVDVAWLTASLFNAVVDDDVAALDGIRWLLVGGEALSVPHVRRALDALPGTTVINGYGPTECTTFTCCGAVERPLAPDAATIPIGRPIANTRVYVLDARRAPVPIGTPGELYVAGPGLARGYLRRPELTAAKFVAAPWDTGERLYRTGDLVRHRADGRLEFLGRLDDQVKLRGYRVEVGEIERTLASCPAVSEAVVVLRDDPPIGKRLVAYVVPREARVAGAPPAPRPPLAEELCRLTRARLPEYMVPSAVVVLRALPLTPSGKVDRRTLPAPDPDVPPRGDAPRDDAPRGPVETAIREAWVEALGVAPAGADRDFFEAGGHSLLLVRLAHGIRQRLGRDVPLSSLCRAPTIAALTTLLERDDGASPWSPLVALRATGSMPPLFLIHEGGGNVVRLRTLGRHLAREQPVYALQAVGLNGGQPHDRIADMAALYVREMRRVQPAGPYRVGGASFGGVVAFEMAQQLDAAGESVALLALFDSSLHPRHMVSRAAWLRFQAARVALHVRQVVHERRPRAYVIDHTRGLRRRVRDWYGARLHDGGAQDAEFVPAAYADVWEAARKAYHDYTPRPYRGRVTLFRALTREPGCPKDPAPDWRHWAAGGVEVIDVPGGHSTLLAEPHVRTLAAALSDCLGRAAGESRR